MARFLNRRYPFGTALSFFVIALAGQPLLAGGSFFGAEDQARMCLATANTVTESTRCIATRETASGIRECTQWAEAPCASPIQFVDGQFICPASKACAKLLDEAEPICELDGEGDKRCDIVTPGQEVERALEEQLEVAP
jgi:hypothetical protein